MEENKFHHVIAAGADRVICIICHNIYSCINAKEKKIMASLKYKYSIQLN